MSHTAHLPRTFDRRYSIQLLDGGEPKTPPPTPNLPIRVVIDQVEILTDVIDGLEVAVEHYDADPVRFLKAREQLVELMDRAIHHESDLEVRYAQLLEAARAQIAETGNVTENGPLVHLRHALAKYGQLPPAGASPARLLAQA